MRMCIVRRRGAVRRPSRMRNAGGRGELARVCLYRQVGNACRGNESLEMRRRAAVDDGETSRVVAALLEPPDALDQHRNYVTSRCRADDPAHNDLLVPISLFSVSSPAVA